MSLTLDPALLTRLPEDGFEAVLARLRQLLPGLDVPSLVTLVQQHPDWEVRALALACLDPHLASSEDAREAVLQLIHDPLDVVSFPAIALAGTHRLREAAPHLMRIIGAASWFVTPGYQGKPVGVGAAIAHDALLKILGTTDPGRLAAIEQDLLPAPPPPRPPHLDDAVWVPAGEFQAGGRPVFNHFHMDTRDHPPATVRLPGFWIDRHAVSNRRYRAFLEDVGDSKAFAHPDEPPHKDHTPAYWRDPRFNGADLPVTGIDWYDAWAFARWAGGMLPSELEWEKAARGPDGRAYPWGAWEAGRANDASRAFGSAPKNLSDLETLQRAVSNQHPAEPLLPVDALPTGDSPYGARQMSGNVWEMTRTNFVTREDMDPFFCGQPQEAFYTRREALYVIRGGAWSSPPVCLMTWYRCQELITCRQREIGFRCVYRAPGPR